MPADNQQEEFCQRVCSFVKYKRVHKEISKELLDHIEDHVDYLIEQGISKEEAERQAIEAMGDPEEIGRELDKQHRPLLGWILGITNVIKVVGIMYCLGVILFTGLIVLISFSPIGSSYDKEHVLYTENLNQKQKAGAITYKLKKIIVMDDSTILVRYNTYSDNIDGIFRGWSHPGLAVYDAEDNRYYGGGSRSGGIVSKHEMRVRNFPLNEGKITLKAHTYYGDLVFTIPLKGVK
ncbi:MAG: permease prefix domain 1-containing protein [Peptococcales bacterium]|jgi:hypothetical protein